MNPIQFILNKLLRRSKGEIADTLRVGVTSIFEKQIGALEKARSLYSDDCSDISDAKADLRQQIAELDVEYLTNINGITSTNKVLDKLREFVA